VIVAVVIACKIAEPTAFVATPLAGDTTPPTPPTVEWTIREPRALILGGCGDCGDIGIISLRPRSTDDRGDQIGYRITDVDGDLMMRLDQPVVPERDGRIVLPYRGGGFTVELVVQAIDRNGNASPPVRISIDVPRHIKWLRYVAIAGFFGLLWLFASWMRRRRRLRV
jgi:hypothetical protein